MSKEIDLSRVRADHHFVEIPLPCGRLLWASLAPSDTSCAQQMLLHTLASTGTDLDLVVHPEKTDAALREEDVLAWPDDVTPAAHAEDHANWQVQQEAYGAPLPPHVDARWRARVQYQPLYGGDIILINSEGAAYIATSEDFSAVVAAFALVTDRPTALVDEVFESCSECLAAEDLDLDVGLSGWTQPTRSRTESAEWPELCGCDMPACECPSPRACRCDQDTVIEVDPWRHLR